MVCLVLCVYDVLIQYPFCNLAVSTASHMLNFLLLLMHAIGDIHVGGVTMAARSTDTVKISSIESTRGKNKLLSISGLRVGD